MRILGLCYSCSEQHRGGGGDEDRIRTSRRSTASSNCIAGRGLGGFRYDNYDEGDDGNDDADQVRGVSVSESVSLQSPRPNVVCYLLASS